MYNLSPISKILQYVVKLLRIVKSQKKAINATEGKVANKIKLYTSKLENVGASQQGLNLFWNGFTIWS